MRPVALRRLRARRRARRVRGRGGLCGQPPVRPIVTANWRVRVLHGLPQCAAALPVPHYAPHPLPLPQRVPTTPSHPPPVRTGQLRYLNQVGRRPASSPPTPPARLPAPASARSRWESRLSPGGVRQVSSQGAHPCHLSVDSGCTHVLVANYSSGTAAALPIDSATGALRTATATVRDEPHGPCFT